MSDVPPNIERQRRAGYALLAGAALVGIGSIVAMQYYGFPLVSYLGILVPVSILSFFGYRAVTASNERVALQDERTKQLYERVGFNAFWLLISAITIDEVFNLSPDELAGSIYVATGVILHLVFTLYYKYVE
jgi:hypothetical protein